MIPLWNGSLWLSLGRKQRYNPFEMLLGLVPSYPQVLYVSLVSAIVILGSGSLAGALKRYAGWKTGYTRKTLHFLIFFSAVGLHILGWERMAL